jgi:hypothetical protein
MTEKDAATLSRLVASCREQLENDLVELVEELGPALVQDVAARTYPAREPERRIAAATLKQALSTHWGKVTPALKTALAAAPQNRPDRGSNRGFGQPAAAERRRGIDTDRLQRGARPTHHRLPRRDQPAGTADFLPDAAQRDEPGDTSFKVASLWPCLQAACCEVTDDTAARILLLKLVGRTPRYRTAPTLSRRQRSPDRCRHPAAPQAQLPGYGARRPPRGGRRIGQGGEHPGPAGEGAHQGGLLPPNRAR